MLVWIGKEFTKEELAKKLNLKADDVMVEDDEITGIFAEKNDYDFYFEDYDIPEEKKLSIIKEAMNDDDVNTLIDARVGELVSFYGNRPD